MNKKLDLNVVCELLQNYRRLLQSEELKFQVLGCDNEKIIRQIQTVDDSLSIIEGAKTQNVELEQWTLPEAQEQLNNKLSGIMGVLAGKSKPF